MFVFNELIKSKYNLIMHANIIMVTTLIQNKIIILTESQ